MPQDYCNTCVLWVQVHMCTSGCSSCLVVGTHILLQHKDTFHIGAPVNSNPLLQQQIEWGGLPSLQQPRQQQDIVHRGCSDTAPGLTVSYSSPFRDSPWLPNRIRTSQSLAINACAAALLLKQLATTPLVPSSSISFFFKMARLMCVVAVFLPGLINICVL